MSSADAHNFSKKSGKVLFPKFQDFPKSLNVKFLKTQ